MLLLIVTVPPLLKMPPPPLAVPGEVEELPERVLLLSVSVPPLRMPPPSAENPSRMVMSWIVAVTPLLIENTESPLPPDPPPSTAVLVTP